MIIISFFYEYFTNIFILLFSDPDLDIQVDLKREEEEKNGRRKYLHKRFSCIVDLLRNRKQISPQKQSFIDFVLFWKFYTPTTTHHNGFLGFLFKTLEPWDSKAPKCKPYHYLIENRALVKQRELKVLF